MPNKIAFFLALFLALFARSSPGIILLETDDPARNTTSPGDNSGWQYEGLFGSFLGTPVAPLYFLSAAHFPNQGTLVFHGVTHTVVANYFDPTSDLILYKVDQPFSAYAPLFTASAGPETGRALRVFGRGTDRGAERRLNTELRGWDWGAGNATPRWGSNVVSQIITSGGAPYLFAAFDNPGVPNEAHLSVGDSGGGVFIQEDGLWKLAAINYAVDDLYTSASDAGFIFTAVFDSRGFYEKLADGSFNQITGNSPVPTGFYSTRVAARLAWIQSITGQDPTILPTESFAAWLTLYFTPAERADPAQSGPAADPDGDGVSNLLEYAFNLDPRFPEPATSTAGTGLRGLPLIRVETVGADQRLTVEFLRRTTASGAGLTYAAQFATDLAAANWQTGGTTSVTPINARWERVKATDSVAINAATRRYARVAVMQN